MTTNKHQLIHAIAEKTMEYPFKVWGYGEGIALEALWEATLITGNEQYKQFVIDIYERWLSRPIEEADHSASGILLLSIYQEIQDKRYLERAIALADYLLDLPQDQTGAAFHRPQHPDYHHFLYVDCMEVDAPFLCKLARVSHNSSYYDEAVNQILQYAELLQDTTTSLFFHQYNGETAQVNGAFWGRGNGWALLGLVKTLLLLPKTHSKYSLIHDRFVRLSKALASFQATDGTWHTVLNMPSSYKEGSLPAMFGYGIQLGIENKLLDDTFSPVVRKAWNAMQKNIEDGLLKSVSIATPPGNATHYAQIETGLGFPWGQGPALLSVIQPSYS